MISQKDTTTTTLSPATTTTPIANSITSSINQHNHQDNSLNILKGKSSKNLQVKKRKRFEETIIDGFSIIAFKTWEDLQDELNERSSTTNSNSANSNTQSINGTSNSTAADKKSNSKQKQKNASNPLSATTNSSSSCIINNQLATGSPGTDNSNTTSTTNATSTTISTNSSLKEASGVGKKKESAKRTNANSQANSKDKRNKTSSSTEKLNLKRALEASEKRLSILQEKLKQEQIKNRSTNHNSNNNNNSNNSGSKTKNNDDSEGIKREQQPQQQQKQQKQKHDQASIVVSNHHYSSQQTPTQHIIKVDEITHTSTLRPNGMLSQDLIKEPNSQTSLPVKPTPYSTFHINPQMSRPTQIIHPQSIHQLHPQQSLSHPCMHPSQPQLQSQPQKHSSHLHQSQDSTTPLPPPLSSHSQQPHHHHHHHQQQQQQQSQQQTSTSTPPPSVPHTLHSHLHHQANLQYQRQPPLGTLPQPSLINPPPAPSPMQRHLLQQQQQQHHHHYSQTQQTHHHPAPPFSSPLHPYPTHPQASTMMSSMSMSSLPDPYSCPPSIYITDTITRQTNIIPPLGPALGQLAPQSAQTSGRFGHSSVSHAITPYNPVVPPHQSMYYPTLPTERSFIEFARSYTGPGHLGGYPNLMNSLPPASNITTNPYSFADRWPRIALDHQRAVSSYNRLYQQSTTTLPDRTTYASSYASTRPPHFPAGLFPPPF